MPGKSMPVKEAARIADQIAKELDMELVDVELVKEPTGRFLRFFVEKGDGISLNELEVYHKRIQPLVERVDYDYMEVSSPGLDRPLKTPRDFERAVGLEVELKTYRPVNGSKHFEGELTGYEDGLITIKLPSGDLASFDKKDVSLIRPSIKFDEDDLKDDIPQN